MEKIKQALDKARQERSTGKVETSPAEPRSSHHATNVSYTKTRDIECSRQLLKDNRIVSALEHGKFSDSLKILSTQVLQRMVENHWGSLAVTSTATGEGKTTTAINLGISIAREVEYTVLLVDANLRAPSINKYFGFQTEFGLSDYLTSDIELSDVLVHPAGIDHFIVLPAGKPYMSSSELLRSPKMCSLVQELTSRYPKRIIIFDTPPILETADTIAFLPCVDAALVVVEDDETRSNDLQKAIDMLSVTNVIGTVLNKSVYGI